MKALSRVPYADQLTAAERASLPRLGVDHQSPVASASPAPTAPLSYEDLERRYDAQIPPRKLAALRPEPSLAEQIEALEIRAAKFDEGAAEYEQSADRWAAQGQNVQAAHNLAQAKTWRVRAQELRTQADVLRQRFQLIAAE